MPLIPKAIYEDFKNGELDKNLATELLITLIDNSESTDTRIESIRILNKIPLNDHQTFKFLEHLMISDLDKNVRNLTCKVLANHYLDKVIVPISWMLEHEKSIKCLVTGVSTLSDINTDDSKSILINKLSRLYTRDDKFNLKDVFKRRKIESLSTQDLAEILLNYFVISFLKRKYGFITYDINEMGLISKLELSNVDPQGISLPNFLDSIFSLKSLKSFDLRFNHLIELPEISNESTSLTSVDLSYNNLISLSKSIEKLKSLKILNLKSNRLRSLPDTLSNLSLLQKLNLRNNMLKRIPPSITCLKSLEYLDLHGNKLTSIDVKLSNSIEEIELGWNNFIKFPSNIKYLTRLKKLGMSGNKIKKIPKWISSLYSLKILDLYDNDILSLPDSIGNLRNLQILSLRNNHLSTLPESIIYLKNLKKLDLSWNSLEYLPDWIEHLTSLEELNLWGNKLESIPKSIVSLQNLKMLDLNFNKFEQIPPFLKELERKNRLIIKF